MRPTAISFHAKGIDPASIVFGIIIRKVQSDQDKAIFEVVTKGGKDILVPSYVGALSVAITRAAKAMLETIIEEDSTSSAPTAPC